ncbi:unnamed protein product [Vicia faba]|uniref:Uncharacterized protein n=1 Tax=Vicia faba TaxID=3906 RepID=A0AAV0YF03_VICFA|nr:unnamed protein product [Vicia faba]
MLGSNLSDDNRRHWMEILKVKNVFGWRCPSIEIQKDLIFQELINENQYQWVDHGFLRIVFIIDSFVKVENALIKASKPMSDFAGARGQELSDYFENWRDFKDHFFLGYPWTLEAHFSFFKTLGEKSMMTNHCWVPLSRDQTSSSMPDKGHDDQVCTSAGNNNKGCNP